MSLVERNAAYRQTEVGLIPDDWNTFPCSALSAFITVGIVVRPAQYYVANGVAALRSANIREDGISDAEMVFISERANALLSKSQVRSGDVLTVRTGYPGTSAVVPPRLSGANCIDILITRPIGAVVSSRFLAAWINSSHGRGQVLRNQGGLAQQHFNVGDLRDLLVALPPTKAEQEAIAEALSDADALVESLEQLLAKKRHLKQGVMQDLLTGKKRLPGFSGSWSAVPLGRLFTFKNGLNKAKQFFGRGTPIVNYMDVYKRPGLRVSEIRGRVSLNSNEIATFDVRGGDVFFTRTSETVDEIGLTAVMLDECRDVVFSGFLLRARPKDDTLVDAFKMYCFRTAGVREQITSSASYTTRALTNGRLLSSVLLDLPERPEQAAIATVISEMDADLAALEAKLAKARQVKLGMMQELLTGRIRLV